MQKQKPKFSIDELALIPDNIDLKQDQITKAQKILCESKDLKPTPLKFLNLSEKNDLINIVLNSKQPISKFWILPWDIGDKFFSEDNAGIDIVCAISPNCPIKNLFIISDEIQEAVRKNLKKGFETEIHIRCIWENILENCVPNEVLPTYRPDWEN